MSCACALCDKPISNADAFFELNCGVHLGHAHHKTLKCGCSSGGGGSGSPVAAQVAQVGQVAAAPEVSSKHMRMLHRDASEPLLPKQRGPVSMFVGAVLSGVSQMVAASAPVEESTDPFVLLKAQVPLASIMVGKHAIGIAELINDHGVTINDFFGNGYTIGDMCDAFPTRMNPQGGLDVLSNLGMHEEHFRRFPQLSQIGIVKDRLGYTPADMVRRFGYQYKSPVTQGGWTLSELVSVGLTMPLVIEAGMTHRNQWEELKQTGTPAELALFGATPSLVAALAVSVPAPLPPVQALTPTPIPIALHQPQQQPVMNVWPVMVPHSQLLSVAQQQQQQLHVPLQAVAPPQPPPQPLHVAEPVIIPPQILAQAAAVQQQAMNRGQMWFLFVIVTLVAAAPAAEESGGSKTAYFVVYTSREVDPHRQYLMGCGASNPDCNTVYYEKERVHKEDTLEKAVAWMNGNGCEPPPHSPFGNGNNGCDNPPNGFKVIGLYAGVPAPVEFKQFGTREETVVEHVVKQVPNKRWAIIGAKEPAQKEEGEGREKFTIIAGEGITLNNAKTGGIRYEKP